MDDSRKKKRGGSKIFKSCFRPTGVSDDPSSPFKPDDQISSNGPGSRATSFSDGSMFERDVSGNGIDSDVRKASSSRGRVSRLFKSVLSDKAIKKKLRKRRSSRPSFDSDIYLSSVSNEKTGNSFDENKLRRVESSDSDLSSSRIASSSLSSSCSSSVNSNSRLLSDGNGSSRTNSLEKKPPRSPENSIAGKIKSAGSNMPVIALCLFSLLSLSVLVIWGKVSAILCTSIWLYLGSCRKIWCANSAGFRAESSVSDSEQCKKTFITRLLDRSSNQGR